MKTKIVGIESGSLFTDKERRVTLQFDDADMMFNRIRIPERALGFRLPVVLDDELDVDIHNFTQQALGGVR